MIQVIRSAVAGLALAALVAGCGTSRHVATSPQDPSLGAGASAAALEARPAETGSATLTRPLYPLAPGNRWHYQRRFAIRMVVASGVPVGEQVQRSQVEHVQSCSEAISGRTYLVERITETTPTATTSTWIRLRQDAGGLYEADVSVLDSPKCEGLALSATTPWLEDPKADGEAFDRAVAGIDDPVRRAAFARAWQGLQARLEVERGLGRGIQGALAHPLGPALPPDGELLRLRYPLYPGQAWAIRDTPRLSARVIGADLMRLPAGRMLGWRIRYRWELAPDDRILVWYGPNGFLRLTLYSEATATDEAGDPIGTVIATEEQVLDAFALVGTHLVASSEAVATGE